MAYGIFIQDSYDLRDWRETSPHPEDSFEHLLLICGVESISSVVNFVEFFTSVYFNPQEIGKACAWAGGFVNLDDLLKTLGSESLGVTCLAEVLLVICDAFKTLAVFWRGKQGLIAVYLAIICCLGVFLFIIWILKLIRIELNVGLISNYY